MNIYDETLTRLALEHDIVLADPQPSDTDADVAVRLPGWPGTTAYKVKVYPTRLTPSALAKVVDHSTPRPPVRLLVVVPAASAAFLEDARRRGVSVVVAAPSPTSRSRGHLIGHDNRVLPLVTANDPSPEPARSRGPVPWAAFAVAMELAAGPARQQDIAAKLGITQGAVSRSIRSLAKPSALGGLPHRPSGRPGSGFDTAKADHHELERLLQWLAATYPRDSRATTTWLTLANPNDAARTASDLLTEHGIQHAISGQVAADLYAPWARPQRALIWARRLLDLSEAGATPVPSDDANLVVAVPADPHMFVDVEARDGLPVLAPIRVWIDLTRDGDDQAAEAMERWLLKRARP